MAVQLQGSDIAKKRICVFIEVLAGTVSITDACEALEISNAMYYKLERRSLQSMVKALEPRPKGIQSTPESQIKRLQDKIVMLERDLKRYQSLVRTTRRTIGVDALNEDPKKNTGKKILKKELSRIEEKV